MERTRASGHFQSLDADMELLASSLEDDERPTADPISPNIALVVAGIVMPTMALLPYGEPETSQVTIGIATYLLTLADREPAGWMCDPRITQGIGLPDEPWAADERARLVEMAESKLATATARMTDHFRLPIETALVSLTDSDAPGHEAAYRAFAFGLSLNAGVILDAARG